MADAATVLAAAGMQNAAVIVQAARMEGMDLAAAATLVAGESWGAHIWGHDPGDTSGIYVKGGPVTRANYLAYRDAMKAGRIKRQGCGISQATSAQYQDTADQLGGCWDPLANARSGFRGMQALMGRYGTRDGARRYNGSGPAAEAYADSFMTRLATWQSRLAGASPPDVGAPVSVITTAPTSRSRRSEDTILYFKSPEPAPGQAKKDWPTILVPYAFDPIGGWGGKCILKVDWFGRGGWLKVGEWWIRDTGWSANAPKHHPYLHPVGPNGSERFVGFGWQTAPPVGADEIQVTTSCPDGLTINVVYEK